MQTVSSSAGHGTYVVTYDVASRLQAFRSGGLAVPNQNDPIFRSFHQLLFEKIKNALPGVNIHAISMDRVRLKIWKEVDRRIQNMASQVVLSNCQEIADSNPKSEGLVLNINRIFGRDGEMIGYGPRPRFKSLDEQLEDLAKKIAGRSIVLIEDGAFTGGTIRFVLNRLSGLGLKVTAVVIGFCCTRAYALLKEIFDGELVIVDPLENLVDWIPDHDLIPFIPNCGRVLGEQSPSGFVAVQRTDGASSAYPYILPFGKIEKWASIPTAGARDLSRLCLDTSVKIFGRVRKHDQHQVTIGELIQACPRVLIPIEIGSDQGILSSDTGVVSFLKQMRAKLV